MRHAKANAPTFEIAVAINACCHQKHSVLVVLVAKRIRTWRLSPGIKTLFYRILI